MSSSGPLPENSPHGDRLALGSFSAIERHRLSRTLKRAVRRARESDANFRGLFFQSAEGLLLVDRGGVVLLTNPAAEAIFGQPAARIVGKRIAVPRPDGVLHDIALPRPGRKAVPVRVRATELRGEGEERILVSIQDQRGRKRGERIAAARDVHRGLLPRRMQARSGRVEASAWNEYCQDASGDYYDLLDLGRDRLGVAVGDVAGHGLDAAVWMAQARAYLRAYWRAEAGLPRVLQSVNRAMVRDMTKGRFMTLFLAQVDVGSGALRWCNAGHPSALLWRASTGVVERLRSSAPPVGIGSETAFPAGPRHVLGPDDVLLVTTDGVTEARGSGGARFGEPRLAECLKRLAARRTARIVEGVRSELAAWTRSRPLQDDVTVVALKWLAEGRDDGESSKRAPVPRR